MSIEYFYKPKTVKAALGLKKAHKNQSVYLAGGTAVNSKPFLIKPVHIISLEGLRLNKITKRKTISV